MTRAPQDYESPAVNACQEERSSRLLGLGIVLFWGSLYVYFPILPTYAQSMGAGPAQVGLIVGSYGLSQALLRIPLGLYADLRGARKPITFLGFAAALAGALGLALSRSPGGLLFFRAVTGVAAATWVVTSVMLAACYPPRRAVRATSLAMFLTAGGQVLSTSAGGVLAQRWGWHAPFIAGIALAALGAASVLRVGEARPFPRRQPATFQQVVAYAQGGPLLATSVAAALFQYVSTATTGAFVPLYAASLGASRAGLGWVTSAVLVAYTAAALGGGLAAERIGERRTLLVGTALLTAATLAVPFCLTMRQLMAMRALYGLGMGFVSPVLMGLSIKSTPEEGRAAAMGFFQAVYAVGMFAGPAVSGLVGQQWGTRAVFWTGGLVALCIGFLALKATQSQR